MKKQGRNLTAVVIVFVMLASSSLTHGAGLRSIRRMYRQKEYDRARQALTDELSELKGKSHSEGMLLLARLETDASRAEELFLRIVSSGRPRDVMRARIELAKLYYTVGEYERAARILSTLPADEYHGDRLEAIYLRALCWKQLGEITRSRLDLERIDRGDFLYWSYMTLAELDMLDGKIENARERYETIAGGHSNPIAGFKLGECYEILGEREKAVKEYRTLASNFPKSLEAPKAREKIQMIQSPRRIRRSLEPLQGGDGEEAAGDDRQIDDTETFGFTIQLGAFSERENAIRLAKDVESVASGIRVERIESAGRIWHRVRVGKFRSRAEAHRYAEYIERETGYSSKVLSR